MKILEQILQEIEEKIDKVSAGEACGLYVAIQIIRSHMGDDGWIPVDEKLPENSKYKGAFCPKYRVLTKYGKTVGWYNPDFESWHVLIWFRLIDFLRQKLILREVMFLKS